MTQEVVKRAVDMLNKGYNMNQVAAVLVVDRVALMDAINAASGLNAEPKPAKTKKVETHIEPMFEEEPGL